MWLSQKLFFPFAFNRLYKIIVQNLNLARVTRETEINFCGRGDKTAIIYDAHRDSRSLGPSKLCSHFNMAAVKIRYGRLFCIFRLCYKPECSFPQGIAVRGLCSTIISKLYYKTPLLSGKKLNWNGIRTTHDVFLKPRSFGQVDLRTRSRSKEVHSSRGEEDSEYDSESEDENILVGKSNKRKQKCDQAAKFRKSKLRQKSAKTMTLRPSKYLFRDRKDWNEEKQWKGREIPEDLKSKASWYSRQMAKLANEGEVRIRTPYIWRLCGQNL